MPKVHKRTRMLTLIVICLHRKLTPRNQSTSPIPSSSSNNGLDFINQNVARSEEHQRKRLERKEKKLDLKTRKEECKA